jgi:hypothetical protein
MKPTEDYVNQLRELHKKESFGVGKDIPAIVNKLLKTNNVQSVLDFGSGKGYTSASIKSQYPDIIVYSYDPVTSNIDLPETVDLVYSSDVLEHVEPEMLDETLLDLSNRASKYQYHLIACHPAKKFLSNGKNAHLIIETPAWWKNKIENLNNWKIDEEFITEKTRLLKDGSTLNVIKYVVLLSKEQ